MEIHRNRAISTMRTLGFFTGACALLLTSILPLRPVGAAEITGRITVAASGAEILPGRPPSLPLKEVEVHVGFIERLNNPEALYGYVGSAYTDDDGNYTIEIGPDPPPEEPAFPVDHVVIVILESQDHAVAVYDNDNDPIAVACLGTDVIPVPTRGSTRVDIDLTAEANDDSAYQARASDFRPTEDKVAYPVVGVQPRCTRDTLGVSVFPESSYDQRGLTNARPERFAHLAIHYVRTFDAYEFVRDGLGKGSFTPVRVNGWDDTVPSMAYNCAEHAILINPVPSFFAGRPSRSATFSTRHEYGHHFMCASPIGGSDNIPPLAPGDFYHEGIANSNSTDAWTEGFATWFAAAVAEYQAENRPYVLMTQTGELDLLSGGALIDDPSAAGRQSAYGQLQEEFAVATVLWQASNVTGSTVLLDSLEGGTDLDNFSRVHTRLGSDVSVASFFDTMPCGSVDPGLFVFGIDCLFIERGFYHDRDGDGLYGPDLIAGGNELVGLTRWELAATEYRLGVPEIEGSRLRLHVENPDGDPVSIAAFDVAIQYDPPFEHANSGYLESVSGDGPYEFPILVPGRPSRALVTPITSGPETSDPLVIESAFFHEQIDPFREGGVPPILTEHTFVVDVPEPAMSASLLPALALLALLSDRRRSVSR